MERVEERGLSSMRAGPVLLGAESMEAANLWSSTSPTLERPWEWTAITAGTGVITSQIIGNID